MKKIIMYFVVAFALIGMAVVVVWLFSIGLEKSDRVECEKLKRQSQEYYLFYLTQNEKEMCDYLGVTIDAPVR